MTSPLSDRHIEALIAERGVAVDHATINRWVNKSSPQLEAAFHRRKRPVWVRWRMDETSVRVKGQWRYLSRAVDKHGQTLDFLLTAHRDKEAACRFLKKAIGRHGIPETITTDGSDANEAVMRRYNQEYGTAMVIRQGKYLNNIVEQDHCAVKRITRPMLGLKSFDAAQSTLAGVALMRMLKKRQRMAEAGDEGLTAFEQFYALAKSSPSTEELLTSKRLHTKICDTAKETAMSATSLTRRDVLATTAAAAAFSLLGEHMPQAAEGNNAIRPFRVNVPQGALADLRRRIKATRWPERETVRCIARRTARTTQKLVRYWATEYDWRKVEAKLNAVPQFVTEIDGLDIHFIHVRSKHKNALPLIVTHGWPGSIIEQLKIIDP